MNRRSAKLDKYLGKVVTVTFWDGDEITGILEFGRPFAGLKISSNLYSVYNSDGDFFFRKSHVTKIKEIGKEKNNG